MSYTEALARVAQIQGEIEALAGRKASTASAVASSTASSTPATSFAQTLSQAQAQTPPSSSSPASAMSGTSVTGSGWADFPATDTPPSTAGGYGAGTLSGTSGYYPTAFLPGSYEAGALGALPSAATLPAGALGKLTPDQQQFAERLSAATGLDPGVVSAWLLAEESGVAASSREREGNNDWLNIGYTDSGTYGSRDSVWSTPSAAAEATAGWLQGQETIPGYGRASSGIQSILASAGQAPESQIAAIQQSGWASSAYPDLPALFQQVAG